MDEILTKEQIDELEKQLGFQFSEIFSSQSDVVGYIENSKYRFDDCLFNCDVSFQKLLIEGQGIIPIDFRRTVFAGEADFSYVTFKASASFENALFKNRVSFNQVEFHECINPYKPDMYPYVSFYGAKFLGEADFHYAIFNVKANFSETFFSGFANFFGVKVDKFVDFSDSTFEQEAIFDFPWEEKTQQPYFNGKFDDVIFNKKATFNHRLLNEITFENAKFEALAGFYDTEFNSNIRFLRTDFLGTCVFSRSIFKQRVIFHYTQVAKNMIFRDANFFGGLNLAPLNLIDKGYINTFNINVTDFKADDIYVDIDHANNWTKISSKHKRETFRILKNESIKSNNRIDSLEFHAKEMEAYEEELKYAKWNEGNKVLLWLNKKSNLYGLSWKRGLCFTFKVSVITYLLYVSILPNKPFVWGWSGIDNWLNAVSDTLKYYPEFLYPGHSFNFISDNYHGFPLVADLFGRICVGFGIYQTIQAFRKYGRF